MADNFRTDLDQLLPQRRQRPLLHGIGQRQGTHEVAEAIGVEGHEMLVISYLNHHDVLASETLYFDKKGLVFQAVACHRPDLD